MVQDVSAEAPTPADPPIPLSNGRAAAEIFAANLMQAALTAQAALSANLAERPDVRAASPDPMHLGASFHEVAQRFAASPESLVAAQFDLFTRYVELWSRTAATAPPPAPDKRFKDPEWSANPMFEMMKSSYLVAADWLNGLVDRVDGIDPVARRRIAFATRLMTDAFSPANFLFSNPVALREAADTQGASLLRGAQAFARDMASGGGELVIRQTDDAGFEVGVNLATTPGKVVFQNDVIQLLQFDPATPTVFELPLLIFPPWINKYYILDLKPQNSMIRWLTEQGLTVFVVSWVNPTPAHAARGLESYMQDGAYAAIEAVLRQCGTAQLNAVGYCSGGTLLSCTLAHMAARADTRVACATLFAAQQDFSQAGDLLMFVDDAWLAEVAERIARAGGVLPSKVMADTFNLLRANDLIWSFWVSNYLLGKEPAPFDLLFWNADQTRMPGALHLQYLTDFYHHNRLPSRTYPLGGETIDLSKVDIPIYVQASREDHIAPMRSVYNGVHLFGGPVQFTLAGSGHIAGVVNHPAASKYQHWTNPALPPTLEAWMAGAEDHKGSWWPHWAAWLTPRSGAQLPARDPATGPLGVIEDAPGTYVKVRS